MAAPANTPASPPAAEAEFRPLVPDDSTMREFTFQAVVTGTLLGLVFGASSLYLVMKVGLTVSASIPVAVLSITLFRALSKLFGTRTPTILENNITQTAGSAGESIAFGVGVTMPGLMLLGFDMSLTRVMIVSVLGGLLGIFMMIPLRRAFIVRLHGKAGEPGKLLYPEGTACAAVLQTGEQGGTSGSTVFIGFFIAFVHKLILQLFRVLPETIAWPLTFFNRAAVIATDAAGELVGVGYIIGFRTSAVMMAGAIVGYLVIAPTINIFGANREEFGKVISEMSTSDLRSYYILQIGAGCVSAAGIISMCRTLPMILRTIGAGLGALRGSAAKESQKRTSRDMPMWLVVAGCIGLLGLLAIWLSTELSWNAAILAALLVLAFGFLFVTVSSRLTGEIGSSSNPISGMTIATLLVTCLIFLFLGMTGPSERVLALSIGAVVCIAASNGGTTSQDLKTGFLVGGTPIYQQYAILIGALISAVVIGGTLLVFNSAGTVVADVSKTVKREVEDGKFEEKPNTTLLPRLEADKATDGAQKTVGADSLTLATVKEDKNASKEDLLGVYLVDKDRLVRGLDAETLKKISEKKDYDGKSFLVWRPARCVGFNVTSGRSYLVDDSGMIKFIIDPTVTGTLGERDDGSPVNFKFEAPKTQVMATIINSVLSQRVNWGYLLIGAMIAIALELCGVSSLAFAVGAYIPIANTTPIFLGGLVRWAADAWRNSKQATKTTHDEVAEIAESETSPGVLLASGLIAGGSIAGVLYALLNFLPPGYLKAVDVESKYWMIPTPEDIAPRVADDIALQNLGMSNLLQNASFAVLVMMMLVLFFYGIKRSAMPAPPNRAA